MARIFITNKNYNNNWAYANVIRYVTQNITETGCIGGSNYDFVDPSFAITSMNSVFEKYKSKYGPDTNRLCHYVIAFDSDSTTDKSKITDYLQQLSYTFGTEFQCFWALHLVNPNPVINKSTTVNFIINKISYLDGGYLSDSKAAEFRLIMANLLAQYGIERKYDCKYPQSNALVSQPYAFTSNAATVCATTTPTETAADTQEPQLIQVISYV